MARAAIVVASILVALGVAELGVRLLQLDPSAAAVRPTAVALPEMVPSSRSFAGTVDGQAFLEVHRNGLGFRDWEHSSREAIRILGIGDSFTHGFGVELEESYLSVAERSLWNAAPDKDIGIHKLGMDGVSQYVQLAALQKYLPIVDPHVVVLGFSEDTDIDENLMQDPLLHEILDGKRRFVASKETAGDTLHKWSALARFFKARRLRDAAARDVSAFARAAEAWSGAPHRFEDLVRTGWQRRFIDAFGSKLDDEWRVTENLLDKMRASVEARAGRLVLLRVVSRYAVEGDAWKRAVESVCGHDAGAVSTTCGSLDAEHTSKRLKAYAERHGLLYVDPAPALKAAAGAGESVYLPSPEIHWTRAGHEAVGLELARALGRSLALPASATPTPPKPRRFAALWSLKHAAGSDAGSWIPRLRDNEKGQLAQALLWAEEARIDWVVLPISLDGVDWASSPEASALVSRLETQRRIGMIKATLAFAIRFKEGAPRTVSPTALDTLLGEHIAPRGPSYATACGRPVLFVDHDVQGLDDRVTRIRVDAARTATEAGCNPEPNPSVGEAGCDETRSVMRLCVPALRSGKGFEGDPDVVFASSYDGTGPEAVVPREPEGRLTTAVVADAMSGWKRGAPGPHGPGARALDMYRSFLPLRAVTPSGRTVSVVDPRLSCSGCYSAENTKEGPFVWTGETAEITVRGLEPGSRQRVALDVFATGVAIEVDLEAGGTTEKVPLRLGTVAWEHPILVEPSGALTFKLRVKTFRPPSPTGDAAGQRVLGIAVRDVTVSQVQ